jgi:hypothetical protein
MNPEFDCRFLGGTTRLTGSLRTLIAVIAACTLSRTIDIADLVVVGNTAIAVESDLVTGMVVTGGINDENSFGGAVFNTDPDLSEIINNEPVTWPPSVAIFPPTVNDFMSVKEIVSETR